MSALAIAAVPAALVWLAVGFLMWARDEDDPDEPFPLPSWPIVVGIPAVPGLVVGLATWGVASLVL